MVSAIFVDRPRLAVVVALIITLAGLLALTPHSSRSVPRYRAAASAGDGQVPWRLRRGRGSEHCPADRGAVVGVDKMIYMKSTSSNDGSYTLTVSFPARQ